MLNPLILGVKAQLCDYFDIFKPLACWWDIDGMGKQIAGQESAYLSWKNKEGLVTLGKRCMRNEWGVRESCSRREDRKLFMAN